MSMRLWRRLLWLTLAAVVPVPIVILGPGHVPPLRILMLGAITASVLVVEQASGAVPLLALLLLFQGALYMGLLWLLVLGLFRLGRRVGVVHFALPTLLLMTALIAATVWSPIYRDPYRADSSITNLRHVYE